MKTLTLYEQMGILIPGAVLLIGIVAIVPAAIPILAASGQSVGGLGLFLIAAYALGHAVAALGNLTEEIYWKILGGMPSVWVVRQPPKLLSDSQVTKLQSLIAERFGIDKPAVGGMQVARWKRLFGQVYSFALTTNPERILVFNVTYGLCRGLAAASIAVSALALWKIEGKTAFAVAIGGGVAAAIYLYRMHRFGVHFAREVFNVFLNSALPSANARKGNDGEQGSTEVA